MKITALIENTTEHDDLECEHGLSLYIETEKHKILFDMGQTDMFLRNAEKLAVDVSDIDFAILSHGHYDHGGGLTAFIEANNKAPIYINRYAFKPHYNGTEKYIGLDIQLKDNERIIYTDECETIAEGISLFSCNSKRKNHDLGSFGLTLLENGEFLPDSFQHEQYLVIEENEKSILFSGCSHKGCLDIAEWFKPDVFIGGFHFSKLPTDDTLKGYAEFLNGFDTDFFTCHCTGEVQYEFMKTYMPRLKYLSVGKTINL